MWITNRLARLGSAVALLALLLSGVPVVSAAELNLETVDSGYDQPLYVTHAGDERLFVVEQGGLIRIVGGGVFLDLTGAVSTSGNERGLLGLAFHPDYASNGLFYVNYTRASDGDTVVAEYQVSSGDPDAADAGSGRTLLTIDQPASNHNGGWMGFKNELLYIATGDGGGSPQKRAQNLNKLLGKILRIDPLDPDGGGPKKYGIPSKNPYVGRYGRDEIWARGLRNPWRCSFDSLNGKLWCADVGQNQYEEINRSRTGKGFNYGWPLLEGRHKYPSGSLCTSKCKKLPIAEYTHSSNNPSGCSSVTGGYVARRLGAELYGTYVFGDYCSGKVWMIPANFSAGSALPDPIDTTHNITSFGEGVDGRLYMVTRDGTIYRLTDS